MYNMDVLSSHDSHQVACVLHIFLSMVLVFTSVSIVVSSGHIWSSLMSRKTSNDSLKQLPSVVKPYLCNVPSIHTAAGDNTLELQTIDIM